MTDLLERRIDPDPKPHVQRPRARSYTAVLVVLLGQGLLLGDVQIPVVRAVVGLLVVLVVPTTVLYRRVDWRTENPMARLLYAGGSTVLGAMVVGLALNTALPLVGISRPLDRVPVVLTSLVVDLALVLWRSTVPLGPDGGWAIVARRALHVRFRLAQTLGAASLIAAVLGAVRLNNGAGGGLALAGHALALAAGLALLGRAEGDRTEDGRTLVLVAASMLFSTSLRGWQITGHDIQREYIAFLLTDGAGRWSMAPFPSPYNACLSVNILPTILAHTTGLSGTVVFKVVMQVALVVVPLATYVFASRVVSRRQAVVSALTVIVFPTFYNDMPYLVRQEVAFLFLSLILLVVTETTWTVVRRRMMVLLFGVGVILSHYSTTYLLEIAIAVGTAGLLTMALWRRWRRRPEPVTTSDSRPALLTVFVLVPLAAIAGLWTGPVTHTGAHLDETVRQTIDLVMRGGDDQPGSSDLGYGLFAGRQASPRERLDLYADATLEERSQTASVDRLIADPSQELLHPPIVDPPNLPLTVLGSAIEDAGVDASKLNSALRLGSAAMIQVLLLAGFAAMVLRSRFTAGLTRELRWLCVGVLAALGTVVVLPGLSVSYGVLRAFQQALLVIAPLLAIGARVLTVRLRRFQQLVLAAVWGGLIAILTGVIPAVIGGYPSPLALSNSGIYYDLYYPDQQEVVAARWLEGVARQKPVQLELISDKVTVARMQVYLGASASVRDDFFPSLLRKDSYVYLGPETIAKGQATVFYTGNLISYRYPVGVLEDRLDIVYSSPVTRIYR